MSRPARKPHPAVPPAAPAAPRLAEQVPLIIRLEREVEEEFRPPMLARLKERVAAVDALQSEHDVACSRCGERMHSKGRRSCFTLVRFGKLDLRPQTFRCEGCKVSRRPLLEQLGVEAGRLSGALARLVALLGVIVPYEQAAQLVLLLFGVQVSTMTVWRSVQRLGTAAEKYTEEQARFFGDPCHESPGTSPGPLAVVLGVDGCALGMQVRPKRRRRKGTEPMEALPPVEEGHFREVKTGVLLLPEERVEPSPGRRSVVRRALVTCLGNADQIFERLWAKLHQMSWLGANTVVVIVGDGAEWIWNRAEMFTKRCEILDFWHAVEKAWEFARTRHGQGSAVADQWVARIAKDLRAGQVAAVISRLEALLPTTHESEHRKLLEGLIRYYRSHCERMRYDEYLRLGYGIGSGAVESSHKQVVHARLRQAGMRWSELGARHLLALRVLLLNGQWSLLDRMQMTSLAA
ncbi:MAG TPA: ISKra4 family transposase [Solirubrobacteraceae bacterium]|nr:ISKra4 family transposase [Solirubrobacteraceae bacterium]